MLEYQKEQLPSKKFTVATLNFSGINTNPFQYSDGSDMFQRINTTAKELINIELPGLTEWKVGKIDKQYTSHRLSVGFIQQFQTFTDGTLLNKQEFQGVWKKLYHQSGISSKLKSTEEELELTIKMDYLFYRVILIEVYKLSGIKQLDDKLKSLEVSQLDDFLRKKFNRPASRVSDKAEEAVKYLINKNLDIFFLQEATVCDWTVAVAKQSKYAIKKHHDSVIIYNREKFGEEVSNHKILEHIQDKYGNNLDFNEDTAMVLTSKEDKNYLLFSVHLKSKKQKYLKQADEMFAIMRQVKNTYNELIIIIGMDSNHFVNQEHYYDKQKQKQLFYSAPNKDQYPTTVKQRSYLQAQFNKAGLAVSELKDQIVSNNPIIQYSIQNIQGQPASHQLLPSDLHPYDHYVVFAEIAE